MTLNKIHIIINPAAGNDEPILSYLNTAFQGSGIEWNVSVTKQDGDATQFAEEWLGKVDIIAVYGGDGSISEVAKVLQGTDTPLAILPGGTANVMSKELGIPQETMEAIELLKNPENKIIKMDVASVNSELFFIRVNFGMMAEMVLDASRELKDKVGQLAYGITAVKTILKSETIQYGLTIDGNEVAREGIALTVTNCGSIGIRDYSFLPNISITDGYLDVILLKKADLMSVLRVAGSTLLQTDSEILEHWRCKELRIDFQETQKFILDDCEREAAFLSIQVIPNALKVLVPGSKAS